MTEKYCISFTYEDREGIERDHKEFFPELIYAMNFIARTQALLKADRMRNISNYLFEKIEPSTTSRT